MKKRGARALELSLEHRAWIVENLLAGAAPRDLAAQLATQMSRARAEREVAAIAASPLLPVCAQLARRARRLELVAALGRSHARGAPDRTAVERRPTPPAAEFFRDYWAAHRPVVLTDATAGWPALRKWTPAYFRRRFGGETIEITAGREADPFYDMNFRAHRRRMRMDRFIDRVLAAGPSNDLYMVSNNRTMARPRFRALLGDVRPPPDLFEPPTPGATSLWIGPAGTITPLHHDTTNILFAQLHGPSGSSWCRRRRRRCCSIPCTATTARWTSTASPRRRTPRSGSSTSGRWWWAPATRSTSRRAGGTA